MMKNLSSKVYVAISVISLLATVATCFAFYAVAGGSNFILGGLVLLLGGCSVWAAAQYLTNLEHPHALKK